MYQLQRIVLSLFFASFCSVGFLSAQILQKDTLQVWKKYELMEYTSDPEQLDFEAIDSTKNRHQYMSYLDMQDVERNVLGYRAQTIQNLVFKPQEELGFDLGYHQLDLYRYDYDNVYYFDNEAPLTRLTYVLGFQEEQAFQLVHSQKIKQRFNINIDFQRLSSRGNIGVDRSQQPDVFRQGASSSNLFGELWYRSLNGKYNVAFSYLSNEHEINEHGGVIESDRIELRDTLTTERDLLQPLYDQASRGQRDQHFRFRQSIDFGSFYKFALNDSVNIQKLDPKLRVYHTTEYIREFASYQDLLVDPLNYDTILYNPFTTTDTLRVERWVHRAGVNFLLGKNDWSKYTGQIKAGLKYESIFLSQESDHFGLGFRDIGEYFDNSLFESRFDLRKKDLIGLDLKGVFNLGLTGLNENDLHYSASLGYELEIGGLRVWNSFSSRRPSQLFFRYDTNHSPFNRNESLPNIDITRFGASLSFKRQPIKVSLENNTINNWIVFQTNGTLFREAESIRLTTLKVQSNFKFGRWLIDTNLHFQETNNNILAVPEFLGKVAVHYLTPLFDNATVMDVGITARYWTVYSTLKYEPHLGQFAIDGSNLDTYPIVDLFANFQINRVSVYVRTEHISQGLGGNIYFPTEYISGADRNVRFGFTWLFFD